MIRCDNIRLFGIAISAALACVGAGCNGLDRGAAVPPELSDRAVVPGMTPAIRTWAAALNPEFSREVENSLGYERQHLKSIGHDGPLPRADFLAISGGGADGAFGAGLLNGWTASGERPTFKAVTGISTGALTAPFAFLGPSRDADLKRFYTTLRTSDLIEERSGLAALTSDALTDNRLLREMVAGLVDDAMVAEIRAEHDKGRLLLVLTTNIDARRGVIWNLTAIAASGAPGAKKLIQDVMIASSSIPAAFPPVMIDVDVDGRRHQEMHVDGGCISQVFLYPPSYKLKQTAESRGVVRERRLFIIRNGRIDAEWEPTKRQAMSIAGRAISSLIQTQGLGDLYRIFVDARRDEIDYNVAYIPPSFRVKSAEMFDPAYMSALYQLAYDKAARGYPWLKTPPLYESPTE